MTMLRERLEQMVDVAKRLDEHWVHVTEDGTIGSVRTSHQIHEAVARAKQAEATRDGAQKAASDAVDRARIAEKERDEALAKYRFMVDRAANEKLDGYRELGEKAAHAERERDAWHQVARMWELLARKGADLAIDIEKLYHPDSDNEEIGALVVWSESVYQLPSVEDVRGPDGDAKKETEK